MDEIEKNKYSVSPDHYGRNSLQKRIETLTDWQLRDLDRALNYANMSLETLQQCIDSPDFLPDDKVEDCMRELALIISNIKLEFKKDSPNEKERNSLNLEVKQFLEKYEF